MTLENKLPSIEDRGATGRVIVLAKPACARAQLCSLETVGKPTISESNGLDSNRLNERRREL